MCYNAFFKQNATVFMNDGNLFFYRHVTLVFFSCFLVFFCVLNNRIQFLRKDGVSIENYSHMSFFFYFCVGRVLDVNMKDS